MNNTNINEININEHYTKWYDKALWNATVCMLRSRAVTVYWSNKNRLPKEENKDENTMRGRESA